MRTFRDSNAPALPGLRDRVHQSILRHMRPVAVLALCSVVGFSALVGRHPALAAAVISPLIVFGVVLLIVSAPAVRRLESMGNESTQEYVLDTGRDVSGMSRREKESVVKEWEHRVRHPRALRLFGFFIVAFGFVLLLAARQWVGAGIVAAAAILFVTQTRPEKRR